MGISEEGGKIAVTTVEAMKSVPLAIALLVINAGFIGFSGYVLKTVAVNASERNTQQQQLITGLIEQLKDCSTKLKPQSLNFGYNSEVPHGCDDSKHC